ncbi:hypothetical protein MA16_Dca012424 [Dendrobium catenatum]|uniref:Uncharacterized protein n=1 Tax=Dendrobium catenatum TaxID=906689 RepID=A0A2I0WYD9_9ASPA|nr:hypothetical protein MA16_Dca012424 [Dendrobium catenatum]
MDKGYTASIHHKPNTIIIQLTTTKYVATSRNPGASKALHVKTPSKNADPIPNAESPDKRSGDPSVKMNRLLAIEDSQVAGEARRRSSRLAGNPDRLDKEIASSGETNAGTLDTDLGTVIGFSVPVNGEEKRTTSHRDSRRECGEIFARGMRESVAIPVSGCFLQMGKFLK